MSPPASRYFLYAEDDTDDQEIFKEIIEDVNPDLSVVTCNDGLELIQYLEAIPPGQELPCCVVLDVNMPLWDGLRTLQALKSHPYFNGLTVVMFTTSDGSREAKRSLELGAAAFLTKPVTKTDFTEMAKKFAILCNEVPEIKPA